VQSGSCKNLGVCGTPDAGGASRRSGGGCVMGGGVDSSAQGVGLLLLIVLLGRWTLRPRSAPRGRSPVRAPIV
jgi:hypothetical protein